jgi:hypothetical protein
MSDRRRGDVEERQVEGAVDRSDDDAEAHRVRVTTTR